MYARVFGAGSVALRKQTYLIESGKSLLDELTAEAHGLSGKVNADDRLKLDEYFSSIRDVEGKLKRRRDWLDKPFPTPPAKFALPVEENVDGSFMLDNEDLMWDLMALAVKNDSTRVISLTIPITDRALALDGKLMSEGYHRLSHHGNKQEKIDGLLAIERKHMEGAARFLKSLKDSPDPDGGSLPRFDRHADRQRDGRRRRSSADELSAACRRRGGLKHRRHVSCGEGALKNEMACDLYVTRPARGLGFEVDRFGTSESDLNGILT